MLCIYPKRSIREVPEQNDKSTSTGGGGSWISSRGEGRARTPLQIRLTSDSQEVANAEFSSPMNYLLRWPWRWNGEEKTKWDGRLSASSGVLEGEHDFLRRGRVEQAMVQVLLDVLQARGDRL